MEKVKVIASNNKIIDCEVTTPKRFSDCNNSSIRIQMIKGEFQFIPRGNNFMNSLTSLTIEELQAIIEKLKALNS